MLVLALATVASEPQHLPSPRQQLRVVLLELAEPRATVQRILDYTVVHSHAVSAAVNKNRSITHDIHNHKILQII